jgi:amino acid transporter
MTLGHHNRLEPDIPKGALGTFPGVFTPSVLTILGIILFLRLGYVVGNAGLGRALIIIGLANAISVLTSFSLSAIVTNMKVKGGGDYYLISRTLGLEFGGSIGVALFLAQSVSIAFYCIGFGEAVSSLLPWTEIEILPQMIAALAVAFLFIFAWMGADWATRFQYVVMAALAAALGSFFAGGLSGWDGDLLLQNWAAPHKGPGFWIIFAIFFPAVTGFTQGVSMSGDLKDPGRSLPYGTFAAVGVSIVVYFCSAVVFAAALPGEMLMNDYGAMWRVALIGPLIHVGVIAATLSSAMASFLGAPRILQSLARDRIFPVLLPFAAGSGPAENPRRGVLLASGIALATIALGNLNMVAPVVSMFFLISYGLLNYATYFEARAASPSFRPRFRWYHRRLSLVGWLCCLGVMLAIDLTAGVTAVAVIFGIYQYLKRTGGPARWADSQRSYHLQMIREHLLAATDEQEHPRYWRPQLLTFSNEPQGRDQLLRFSSWLEGGSGLTTVVKILEGSGRTRSRLEEEALQELKSTLKESGVKAFPLVVTSPDLREGISMLVRSYGIGPIRANTILLNWDEAVHSDIDGFGDITDAGHLREVFRFGCNLVIFHSTERGWPSTEELPSGERLIDVWWLGDATSRLMLLLAYLMTRNEDWSGAGIRVLAMDRNKDEARVLEDLKQTLEDVRIGAEPVVVSEMDAETIRTHSSGSSLVFIPLRVRGKQLLGGAGEPLEELFPRLPMTAFVMAAEDLDLEAEPEAGEAGERAAALDAVSDAKKAARTAEKDAETASEEAEKIVGDMNESLVSGGDKSLEKKVRAAMEAREKAIKTSRKAAIARARLERVTKEAEELGITLENAGEKEEES